VCMNVICALFVNNICLRRTGSDLQGKIHCKDSGSQSRCLESGPIRDETGGPQLRSLWNSLSSEVMRTCGPEVHFISEKDTASIFKVQTVEPASNMRLTDFWLLLCFKNGVFWDVTPCGSCKNRRFGGT
jgi:hypothetical protein